MSLLFQTRCLARLCWRVAVSGRMAHAISVIIVITIHNEYCGRIIFCTDSNNVRYVYGDASGVWRSCGIPGRVPGQDSEASQGLPSMHRHVIITNMLPSMLRHVMITNMLPSMHRHVILWPNILCLPPIPWFCPIDTWPLRTDTF